MSVRVEFRWSEDLLARVDAAAGFEPRASWVRRVVELALNGYPITGGPTQETFDAVVAERDRLEDELRALRAVERALAAAEGGGSPARVDQPVPDVPAPAEQPEMDGVPFTDPSDRLRETRRVSPSGPASPRVPFRRDVKPFQRGGS